jgi:hypothetical protein
MDDSNSGQNSGKSHEDETILRTRTTFRLCTPFVLGPIAIIASIPDIGTKIFVGLCLSIPYLGVATAITAFSIDNEVGRKVSRQRQMHRVQAMLQQIEELERLWKQ